MLLYSLKLNPGWLAPDFTLPAIDGTSFHLREEKPQKGIVIIFTCNHCPYAKASWPVLVSLYNRFAPSGVSFVAINANDDSDHPEDSFENMKLFSKKNNILFPYLRDETQETAKKYQAQCTPDIYVLDPSHTLYYHGRINDNWQNPDKVTRNDLEDALNRLTLGDKPPVEQFPSMGCSIKWR